MLLAMYISEYIDRLFDTLGFRAVFIMALSSEIAVCTGLRSKEPEIKAASFERLISV